jgi:hypothetical protein
MFDRKWARSRLAVTLVAVLTIPVAGTSAVIGCGDSAGDSSEPEVTASSATPVPFQSSRDQQLEFSVQLQDRLKAAEAAGQIEAGEGGLFFSTMRREVDPDGYASDHVWTGSGYVSKVSSTRLEIVLYPTGVMLVVNNASGARIKRGVRSTPIQPEDLKSQELITITNLPGQQLALAAFGATWP